MSEIFQQVEDDIRQQKLKEFWVENRAFIIGGIALAIVGTGALSFWRHYDLKQDLAKTANLIEAVKTADTTKIATFASDVGGNHAMIARLNEASLLVNRKQEDAALAVYNEIAGMRGVDSLYRDMARLNALHLKLDRDMDAKALDALHAEADALTSEKSLWRYSALEAKALIFARQAKFADAAEILAKIAGDAMAPQDLRARAMTMRELYAASAEKSTKG